MLGLVLCDFTTIWCFFLKEVYPHSFFWLCFSETDDGCFAQEQFIQSAWKNKDGILVNGPDSIILWSICWLWLLPLCCAAVGTGQLYQPRKQTGDREDAAGRTVSSFDARHLTQSMPLQISLTLQHTCRVHNGSLVIYSFRLIEWSMVALMSPAF